jgi:hypothetical protein
VLQVSVSPREDRASIRARVPGTLGVSLLSRAGYLHTDADAELSSSVNRANHVGITKTTQSV